MKFISFILIAVLMTGFKSGFSQPPPPPPPPPPFYHALDTVKIDLMQYRPFDFNSSLTVGLFADSSEFLTPFGNIASSIMIKPTGNGTYTLTGADTGTFYIMWHIWDTATHAAVTDSAWIVITVFPSSDTLRNHAPFANNDYVLFDTTEEVAVVNVTANDGDPDRDRLAVTALLGATATAHGTFSIDTDGFVEFAAYAGDSIDYNIDSVQYRVCDVNAAHLPRPLCADAWLYVLRYPAYYAYKRGPAAADDHYWMAYAPSVSCYVKDNDCQTNGDRLAMPQITIPPANGTSTLDSDQSVSYTPRTGFTGTDSFEYAVCDTEVVHFPVPRCDTAWCYIHVLSVPLIGPAQTICQYSVPTVSGTGNAIWSASPSNPHATIIADPADSVTQISGFDVTGVYTFYFSDAGGGDTLLITVVTGPSAGPDQTFCHPDSTVTLSGAGSGVWTALSSNPAVVTIDSPNAQNTLVTGLDIMGIYQFYRTASGCSDTVAINISMTPYAGTDQVLCQDSAIMDATGLGLWTQLATNPSQGVFANPDYDSTVIQHFTRSGVYDFVWTVNGCPDTVTVTIDSGCIAGIAPLVAEPVHLWPNPARDRVSISADDLISGIVLTNLAGQELLRYDPAPDRYISIDLSQFDAGLYFAQVRTQAGSVILKVAVER